MLYMVTFTINIPQMFAYIPYMDPMGIDDFLMSRPVVAAPHRYVHCARIHGASIANALKKFPQVPGRRDVGTVPGWT